MFKQVFLLTFYVILFLDFSSADQQFRNVTARIISEDRAVFLIESNAEDTYYLDDNKWYTGGERVKGDSLRYETEEDFHFDFRDFYYEIKYPDQTDFYITYVSAFVQQTSSIGKAYIVDGGIGKMGLLCRFLI